MPQFCLDLGRAYKLDAARVRPNIEVVVSPVDLGRDEQEGPSLWGRRSQDEGTLLRYTDLVSKELSFGVKPRRKHDQVSKYQRSLAIAKARTNMLQWLDKKHIWPSVSNDPNTWLQQRHDWYLATSSRWTCPHFSTEDMSRNVKCSGCPRSILYYGILLLLPNYHLFAMRMARDPKWQEVSTFNALPLAHTYQSFFKMDKLRWVAIAIGLVNLLR